MTIIEDFDESDSLDNYSGATSKASLVSSPVYHGARALQHDTGGFGGYIIYSTSGLSNYPAAGDSFACYFQLAKSDDVANFVFGFQDTDNYYQAQYRSDSNGPRLQKVDAGSGSELTSSASVSLSTGTWHAFRIDWGSGGDIRMRIIEDVEGTSTTVYDKTGTDSDHSTGGIGFGHDNHNGNSSSMYFDEAVDPPAAPSLSVAATRASEVDLDIGGTAGEDEVRIYRSDDGGSTFSEVATLAHGVAPTTYTDSGLTNGKTYQYYVEAVNQAGTGTSSTVSTTTDAPAPTLDSLSVVNGDELDASWTSNSADETAFRVLLSTDGGSTYTQANGDLAGSTTSYQTAEQRDGEQYTVKVRAVYTDATADSGTLQATTVLPDVASGDITPIDASVEDELTLPNPGVSDYGDVRFQLRESGSGNAFGSDIVVAHDGADATFTSLEDGEKYDVRARTETEHVTGAYVEVSDTTLLPAPTFGSPTVSATDVTLSWTDNADNEDDYLVERRKQYDGGTYGAYQTLATLAADSTSYSDGDVQPATTYDYRVTARTEHVTAAETTTITTDSLGYGRDRVGGSGWTVEVDVGGATRRPAVVGEPTFEPSLNQLPRVELPVAPDATWFDEAVEDAPLRVWQDGERLPIEQVADVQERPGATLLVGLGGTDLLEPQRHEFASTDVHAAAETVIDQTPYKRVVDDPSADSTQLADIDSDSEILGVIEDNIATNPYHIDNGSVRPAQTNFWVEAEDEASSGVTDNVDYGAGDPQWSGAEAVDIQTAAGVSTTITTEHEIAASDLELTTRGSYENFEGQLRLFLDGNQISAYQFGGNTIVSEVRDHSGGGLEAGITSDLSPGSHTITVEVGQNTEGNLSGEAYLDAISLHDTRYHDSSSWDFSSWDTDVHFNDPDLFPSSLDIRFLHEGFQSATGATVSVEGVAADNGFGLALSNDGGQTYAGTTTNSTSLSTTFASPGPDVLLRTTHVVHGSRQDETPLTGYETHSVDGWAIDIDTRNSPPLQAATFDASGRDILTDLVERGVAVWAVTWDADGREIAVEVTNAGQRTADRTLNLVDYQWSKATLGRQVEDATIRGGAQRVQGETVTADALGTGEDLDEGFLVPGREQVTGDSGQIYTRGVDYAMAYQNGVVTPLSGGAISKNETLTVDYEWKPFGRFSVTAADPKKAIVETFTSVQSDDLCRSIAGFIVERLGDPVRTGTAVIDDLPAGVSILDALAADPLPSGGTYVVNSVEVSDARVEIEFRDRRSVDGVISDLRTRLGTVSDRV